MRHVKSLTFSLAALLVLAQQAQSQVLYGSLVGNVTDPQQAAVVGAAVSIKNEATGYAAETKTDDRGAFDLRNLPPGTYNVTITAPGFSTFDAKEIVIAANNVVRVDAPLRVGNVSEVITVGAEIAQLQTDKSDLHFDITTQQATQIPISGYRNFQSLMDFVPGAMPSNFQNATTDTPA